MKDYTQVNNDLDFLRGSDEYIQSLNDQLQKDIAIYKTRPFLHKQERNELIEFAGYPGRNQIWANFSFNENGDFLPEAYNAPVETIKMLYPLGELINDERRGTIIIDREQYHPNLQSLSYFIYMVDEELYDYFKTSQGFLDAEGKGIPTFMFNRKVPNGIRVFKSHMQLVRHLRNQRTITYCFGPRTAFYMRYYIKTIETFNISNDYAFGPTVDNGGTAKQFLELMNVHMAFNTVGTDFEIKIEMSEDDYGRFRKLAKKFKTNLPDIREYKNTIMVKRYTKQTMHTRTLIRLTSHGAKKEEYKAMGIEPYHHMVIHKDQVIAYVWDSREIQAIVPLSIFERGHITYSVQDNRTDIVLKQTKTSKELWDKIWELREELPVQIRYEAVTETSEETAQ